MPRLKWLVVRSIAFYGDICRHIGRFIFSRILPILGDTRIELMENLTIFVKLLVPTSVLILIIGIILWNEKITEASALIFGIAGTMKIFISEQWNETVKHYADEEKYPYGPPSYVTRALFAENDPEMLADSDNPMSQYYYWNNGILLIMWGFVVQLLSMLM